MGQQPSRPQPALRLRRKTEPCVHKGSGDGRSPAGRLLWGHSCMRGWRDSMEDAHIARPSILPPDRQSGWARAALFGVMDGHGGEQVARFCELHLPSEIARRPSNDVPAALRTAFLRIDELLLDPRNLPTLRALSSASTPRRRTVDPMETGCTACISCICRDKIFVANAGDCRAVLSRGGLAINMSEDHKPEQPTEFTRIADAGGCVLSQRLGERVVHRVNGDLSLSRSIGDLRYKRNSMLPPEAQIISALPDVRVFHRQANDEFMVLACDGVWDVLSSQQVVDFIRPSLQDLQAGTLRISELVEDLLDYCLSPDPQKTCGIGGDNMTMVIVVFTEKEKLPIPAPQISQSEGLPSLLGCAPCSRKRTILI